MSATSNLDLTIINSSDYVSPDPINENFKKLDELGLDYVVQTGTSGEWWYRKWKSGRAECGIDEKNFGSVPHTTQWYGMYLSAALSFGAYPFSFSVAPNAIVTFHGASNHNSYISFENVSGSTTLSPSFHLVDPNSGTASDAKFGIFVVGRYK